MADDSRTHAATELLKSLDTAVKTVLSDDLRAIREAIKSTEATLLQRLVQSENSNARAIDSLRNEMAGKIAEISKRLEASSQEQARSIKDSEGRLAAASAQVDEKARKGIAEANAAITSLRQTMAGEVAGAKARADHDIETVRGELHGALGQLEVHAGELQRISSVLSGFARIFSGEPAPAAAPAPVQPKPAMAAAPAPSPTVLPQSARKPATPAPTRKSGDGDASSLPSSSDIVQGIDSMFKLGK